MDVEMAYVQDSFLTNDVLQEMVSHLLVAVASGLMVSTSVLVFVVVFLRYGLPVWPKLMVTLSAFSVRG